MERGALKLFGVQIFRGPELQLEVEDEEDDQEEVIRKSASMGNLVSCAAAAAAAGSPNGENSGYHSDGGLLKSARKKRRSAAAAAGQERKRGIPWTEEEHRTFLIGLERLGKGDWRGISRNFVPTRTPTQVASHAQKYFLRQSNPAKKKRRSSLFDVQLSNKAATPETSTVFAVKPSEVIQEENFTISPYNNMVASGGVLITNIGNGPSLYNSYEKPDISSGNKEPVLSLAPVVGGSHQFDTPAVDSTSLELSIALPNSLSRPPISSHGSAGAIKVI